MGTRLSEDEIANKTNLVTNLSEFQKVIASSEEGYVPADETNRLGVTTAEDSPYGKMLANLPVFRGKTVEKGKVEGAEVDGRLDGKYVSSFENLEEAEAFLIGEMIMRKRGRNQVATWPDAVQVGVGVQASLLRDLLTKIGVGERFKISPQDHLFFAMSVLFLIDVGDVRSYRQLTNR